MNTENFTLNGTKDGITFKTVKEQDTYSTVFEGSGFEATFHFKDKDIKGKNPLDMLRSKINTENATPDQFNITADMIYTPSTYFV